MNETIAMLKLASKFGNPKDTGEFMKHVQVIKNDESDVLSFMASNGHIAIRITTKDWAFNDYKQVTIESINRAAKVDTLALIEKGEHEARFPDFNKCFNWKDHDQLFAVGFDCKYLALIFNSIEAFRKDIKVKLARVTIQPLAQDRQNLMTVRINEGLSTEIQIEIALMPLKA